MIQIAYVLTTTVRILLIALQLLMLGRAILSWLPLEEENPVENFLFSLTEPVIAPVRALIDRFGWFEGLPIDMSFFITFILLSVLTAIL
ncbi:MAG: YggT family protein [Clostridia bacterium]|nr:YggT family protein [Clostridia bacterium]MBQ3862204.1 YggT family protein [Clostridia bacterium]MBQ3954718.1 YggT family protein [Clostridia bacterium]MBQ5355898.1 YggT family protein [Clostridia bacterium]